MKLSVSAYRAHAAAHKKILSSYQLNYGSTSVAPTSSSSTSTGITQPAQPNIQFVEEDEDSAGDGGGGGGGGHSKTGGGDSTTDLEEDDPRRPHRGRRRDGSPPPRQQHHVTYGDEVVLKQQQQHHHLPPGTGNTLVVSPTSPASLGTSREEDDDSSNTDCRSPGQRTKSNQRWMKLRTTVQLSSAISTIQKKPPLKREDSFLKRFSTRQSPGPQETVEDTGSEGGGTGDGGDGGGGAGADSAAARRRRRRRMTKSPRSVVNPDENFYFYWLLLQTCCVLYNLWTLIVRQSFPELQVLAENFWTGCDWAGDVAFLLDIVVQLRTGYLEQGLMVYNSRKLAGHYLHSRAFLLDLCALCPLELLQLRTGSAQPLLRFPRFLKVYRAVNYYYMVESRTVWPNLWRVLNLIHILLILAHWFGCFYFLLSEAEGFQGDWVYPYRPGDYATLSRKYLGSLYWSTLTLTTIGDLPTPETNAEKTTSADGPRSLPRRGIKSRLLQFNSNNGYVFTIVSYLIGVFIFATIVGQVGNVITNRNANRLEFERLLDGAKTYMRHHKVPGGMQRRVLRWYDYSWSRGRIQGGGDINTALGLLPDKLKTELALHVNLSVLKKVTIFQECQPEFLHDLVLKMKAYIFTPGDTICRKGEVAREMFIIADGILEVLSETGRVLTTMKAGDFFGEIGILCLDGLNKRTADVRSVGYSELFSLSREDVLAAMKDYPEAQEILQNLGRKRLMEVKNSNAQYAAKLAAHHHKMNARNAEKWQHHHHHGSAPGAGTGVTTTTPNTVSSVAGNGEGGDGGSTDSDANTPRRIVDKIKCEAKGLRKVLRKSRTSRRSGDSIELQPLQPNSGPKGVLRRMSRVRSDELPSQEENGQGICNDPLPTTPPVTSPLGAGLPLLSRLRLLKEKQEREEHQTSSPTPSLPTPLKPIPAETDQPEVIGAGLPLLQRLLLLKAKEAREAKEAIKEIKESPLSPPPITPKIIEEPPEETSLTESNILAPTSPPASRFFTTSTPTIPPTPNTPNLAKPWSKLRKAAILNDNTAVSSLIVPSDVSVSNPSLSRVPDIISDNKTSALDRKERALVVSDRDSSPSSSSSSNRHRPTTIVRKRKPCMLHIRAKNYTSVDDLSPEYCGLPFVKKLKILNERQKLAELESVVKTRSASLDYPESESIGVQDSLTRSHSEACAMQCRGTLCVPLDLHPPLSPESNETLERRTLKSILKKLSEDTQTTDAPVLKHLMRAPTIEGYAARHTKLSKSVTFNRDTLQSPPQDSRPQVLFPIPCRTNAETATQTDSNDFVEQWIVASKSINQVKLMRGDYKASILAPDMTPSLLDEMVVGGIKQVLQCHLQDMQTKFQGLEFEVRKRDEVISQLQSRIHELERTAMVNMTSALNTSSVNVNGNQNASDSRNMRLYLEQRSRSTESQHVILDLDTDEEVFIQTDYENAH